MKEDINLLPEAVKWKRLRRLYFQRLGKFLRLIIFVLIVAVGALMALGAVEYTLGAGVDRELEQRRDDGDETRRQIQEINKFAQAFRAETKQLVPRTEQLEELLKIMPREIKLKALSSNKEEELFVVQGAAAESAALIALERRLEELPWVEKVEAPLQNFATEERGEFLFTLHVKEQDG
jgi:Tfp pilus assembly protein PilN